MWVAGRLVRLLIVMLRKQPRKLLLGNLNRRQQYPSLMRRNCRQKLRGDLGSDSGMNIAKRERHMR